MSTSYVERAWNSKDRSDVAAVCSKHWWGLRCFRSPVCTCRAWAPQRWCMCLPMVVRACGGPYCPVEASAPSLLCRGLGAELCALILLRKVLLLISWLLLLYRLVSAGASFFSRHFRFLFSFVLGALTYFLLERPVCQLPCFLRLGLNKLKISTMICVNCIVQTD